MAGPESLPIEALRWQCDPDTFDFETSDELDGLDYILGQDRAVEAIEFGIGIKCQGYNLFALGPLGADKYDIVRRFLEQQAADEQTPHDLCYVHNFDEQRKPRRLRLPAGRGNELREDMEQLVDELKSAIPAAFESEDFQARQAAINQQYEQKQQEALDDLQEEAEEKGIRIIRTPSGVAFAPIKDGEVIPPDEVEKLSEEEREQAQEAVDELQEKFRKELRGAPKWDRERRKKLRELREEVTAFVVEGPIEELTDKYGGLTDVAAYLESVRDDVVENGEYFVKAKQLENARYEATSAELAQASPFGGGSDSKQSGGGKQRGGKPQQISFRRYNVNVLVDNSELDGAPVIYEDEPSLDRLIGQVEHIAQMGTLVTDFNLIQPGALHRANGGYLIIDARKLLMNPLSWEQLKRALESNQIHIETPKQAMGMARTVTVEPEPVEMQLKVVLLGERHLYYQLEALDHEFSELFKVAADFDDDMDREDNVEEFARLVASFARQECCCPLDRSAMSRVLEHAARMADDQEKFSMRSESVRDLIRESDYWAGRHGNDVIRREDVQKAIDAQRRRASRMRDKVAEQIQRDTLLIDTDGEALGQVNGLSVLSIGNFAFGRPNRITASARLGKGEVIDIEREVELGGPIHSKGIMILAGFLGARFGKEKPLSLTASIVFEQSYGGVDGDSASVAESCALMSELSGLPIRQNLAITGSMNQQGRVQAVGGVNEKIEGFFDVCKERGLTGNQGVLLPDSNLKHLMLREDVVAAVQENRFAIYAIRSVDEAMHLLTGVAPGQRDAEGNYPVDSVNYRIEQTLDEYAERARRYERAEGGGNL